MLDRLNRAKKLQEMKKNHAESSMTVARAALDAQDFSTARREAEAAIRMDRREGAYLLWPTSRRPRPATRARCGSSCPSGAGATRSGLGRRRRRFRALGAGIAGHRQARRLRMAGADGAARSADRQPR